MSANLIATSVVERAWGPREDLLGEARPNQRDFDRLVATIATYAADEADAQRIFNFVDSFPGDLDAAIAAYEGSV